MGTSHVLVNRQNHNLGTRQNISTYIVTSWRLAMSLGFTLIAALQDARWHFDLLYTDWVISKFVFVTNLPSV